MGPKGRCHRIGRWPGQVSVGTSNSVGAQIDLYPTLARLCGTDVPTDRTIDGHDLGSELGLDGPPSDDDRPFFYMRGPSIEAVRVGPWKLHLLKQGEELLRLYNLVDDIAETTDLAADRPEIVARLQALIEEARVDVGDEANGIAGTGSRPMGKVENPVTLTEFDPDHPYFMAEYDLADRG